MATEFIREVRVSNGTETRAMVVERVGGKVMLWDRDNDPNSDGLVELAGATDSDVQDALNDAGEWEVIAE